MKQRPRYQHDARCHLCGKPAAFGWYGTVYTMPMGPGDRDRELPACKECARLHEARRIGASGLSRFYEARPHEAQVLIDILYPPPSTQPQKRQPRRRRDRRQGKPQRR